MRRLIRFFAAGKGNVCGLAALGLDGADGLNPSPGAVRRPLPSGERWGAVDYSPEAVITRLVRVIQGNCSGMDCPDEPGNDAGGGARVVIGALAPPPNLPLKGEVPRGGSGEIVR